MSPRIKLMPGDGRGLVATVVAVMKRAGQYKFKAGQFLDRVARVDIDDYGAVLRVAAEFVEIEAEPKPILAPAVNEDLLF